MDRKRIWITAALAVVIVGLMAADAAACGRRGAGLFGRFRQGGCAATSTNCGASGGCAGASSTVPNCASGGCKIREYLPGAGWIEYDAPLNPGTAIVQGSDGRFYQSGTTSVSQTMPVPVNLPAPSLIPDGTKTPPAPAAPSDMKAIYAEVNGKLVHTGWLRGTQFIPLSPNP